MTAAERETIRAAIDAHVRAGVLGTRELAIPADYRTCPACGVVVFAPRGGRFCSRRCLEADRKARAREARLLELQARRCVGCGAPLEGRERVTARWCSLLCKNAAWSRERRARERVAA